jgi:NADH dehydrogenase FAD-containing subunit
MEPVRNFLRHKKATVKFYEAEATKIDYERKVVMINDESDIKGDISATEVPFDMLVVGVGAENATFGEHDVSEAALSKCLRLLQVFQVFESILSFSRRSMMPKPSGDVSWTAARPRRSKTRPPKRSNVYCTWL